MAAPAATTPKLVAHLVPQLRAAAAAYYNGGKPLMTDAEYDAAVEQLAAADPTNPFLSEVGAPPPVAGATPLPYPMPSLDKIKPGEDRLERFLAGGAAAEGFVLSEKLDGLSALWLPSERRLLLRGDGLKGQEVSHLVGLGVQGLLSATLSPLSAIRGELLLPRSSGEALARAWVNGVVHRDRPDPADVAKLRFVAYEVLTPVKPPKRSAQLRWLVEQGYEVPWFRVVAAGNIAPDDLATALKERRSASAYDTDGIVVGYDVSPKSESTAIKARNPKDAVAFKMPLEDQSATTTVREVIWGTSNQGYLIPKLRFDPVVIGAATIQFCTGHNAKTIKEGGIGPGAVVVIRRSGDVIPKLDRVVEAAPGGASLPVGGTWDATETHIKAAEGAAGSPELVVARLGHFLKTLDIPGAGPATAAALVAAGLAGPAALYKATTENLSKILGPKTGASLHAGLRAAVEKADEMSLMLASSKMPRGVGDTKLRSLVGLEPDPRNWTTMGAAAVPAGWTTASLQAFLDSFGAYEAWRLSELSWIPYPKLVAAVAPVTPAANAKTHPSQVLCLTGFRDKALEAAAAAAGHTISPTFTGKVTLLLVPDGPVKESEKVKAARARGIPIVERTRFEQQYLS